MIFDKDFLNGLLAEAEVSPRLRQNLDLRNSAADTSQRMLNALQPGTEVPVHRHEDTAETVVCLMGRLEEILYTEVPVHRHEDTAETVVCLMGRLEEILYEEPSRGYRGNGGVSHGSPGGDLV